MRTAQLLRVCITVTTSALVFLGGNSAAHAAEPNLLVSETNSASGNVILVYEISADGAARLSQRVATGQRGTGDYMHTANAVHSLTPTRVLAVNAGANTISVLDRTGATMTQISVFPVQGNVPTSIATYRDRAYVLSTGMPVVGDGETSRRIASPMIEGFTIAADGTATSFTKISLAGGCSAYPCKSSVILGGIVISPDGTSLLLSESSMNRVRTFSLDASGAIGASTTTRTQITGPYGAAWASTGAVAISGHTVPKISGAIASGVVREGKFLTSDPGLTLQNSNTCWLAVSPAGTRLFTMDAGTEIRGKNMGVTTLRMSASGKLRVLGRTLVPWSATDFPGDAIVASDGKHLYAKALSGVYVFDIDGRGIAHYAPGKSQFPDPMKLGPTGLAFVAGT